MQLNAVVLPAPLGPMRPTISYSLTSRLTSWRACRPPKRIDRSRTSSTDTGALHRSGPGLLARVQHVVHVERLAGQPVEVRLELLRETAGELHDREQQAERAEQADRELRDVRLRRAGAEREQTGEE